MRKILLFVAIVTILIALTGCSLRSISNNNYDQKSTFEKNSSTVGDNNTNNSQTKSLTSSDGKEDLNSTLNNENNISELQKKGLEIIEDQSFWIDFEKWGKVKFISSQIPDDGSFNLQFYLIDDKGSILYTFPAFYGSQTWFFYELCAISFRDVNKDGLKDVIVITDYVSGAGDGGAIPFPVASVYFQKNKSFVSSTELDSEINDANKNESINMVIKYLKGKNIKLDK